MKFKKVFLIGEIGINHNGDLKNVYKLIDLAVKCGCDAVKFQKRDPEISTPSNQKNKLKDTPWGLITYLKYKKKIELDFEKYRKIDIYCKKKKIIWFASVWDTNSLKVIKKFKPKFYKIPSALITHTKLVREIAKERKFTFISTGMLSSLKEVDKVVKIFKKLKCKFMLMHCVSAYPCPENKLNLSLIKKMEKRYKMPIGYSGHESSVSPSLIAACYGAKAIERHITLDRSMWGSDQAASLGFNGIRNLREILDKLEIVSGNGKKVILKDEKNKLKSMKYW